MNYENFWANEYARAGWTMNPSEKIRQWIVDWDIHNMRRIELGRIADEVYEMEKLLQRRAEEAFISEIVDTKMWIEKARSSGISGVTPKEYREIWIEDWLAGDR